MYIVQEYIYANVLCGQYMEKKCSIHEINKYMITLWNLKNLLSLFEILKTRSHLSVQPIPKTKKELPTSV